MQRITITLVTILSLAAAGCGGPAGLTDAERREIAAGVEAATRGFEAAQRARDAERAISFLAPDFYMYNDGARVGYQDVAGSMRQSFSQFRHVEPGFQNVEVIVQGPAAAVSTLQFRDSITTTAGDLLRFRGATTLVWQLRDGDWAIVYADADHYRN